MPLRFAAEAPKAKAFHTVEPMLGEKRMVEQVVFSWHLAAFGGASHEFVPLVGFTVAAAEPHQRREFGLLKRRQPLDLLHHLFAAEIVLLALQGAQRNFVIDGI